MEEPPPPVVLAAKSVDYNKEDKYITCLQNHKLLRTFRVFRLHRLHSTTLSCMNRISRAEVSKLDFLYHVKCSKLADFEANYRFAKEYGAGEIKFISTISLFLDLLASVKEQSQLYGNTLSRVNRISKAGVNKRDFFAVN